MIAGGGADVIVDWMPSALAAREKGVPLVNIAQPFKRSGMMLTCRKDTGITTPDRLQGQDARRLVLRQRVSVPVLDGASSASRPTARPDGVKVLKQGFNVDPLLQKQADCISTMTYNEYWQVIDAGIKPEDLVVFKYEDQGVATLEDGLYVLEDKPQGPGLRRQDGPLRQGLDEGLGLCARATRTRRSKIVLENDATGAQTEQHQKRMMGEINKLTEGSNGALDVAADYERTVQTLLSGGSDPVITKAPAGAWTPAVTDAAKKL